MTWQEVNSAQAAITSAKDTREWTDNSTREVRVYAQGSVCGGSADIRDAIADMYENLQIEMSKFMPKIIEQCGAVKDKRLEVVYKDSDDPVCCHLLLVMNVANQRTGMR